MIRKITRGTGTVNGSKTISCSITDTSKVIVLLNVDGTRGYFKDTSSNAYAASVGSGNVYLKSVSNSNIVVSGYGITFDYDMGSHSLEKSTITFSYQIIEFM